MRNKYLFLSLFFSFLLFSLTAHAETILNSNWNFTNQTQAENGLFINALGLLNVTNNTYPTFLDSYTDINSPPRTETGIATFAVNRSPYFNSPHDIIIYLLADGGGNQFTVYNYTTVSFSGFAIPNPNYKINYDNSFITMVNSINGTVYAKTYLCWLNQTNGCPTNFFSNIFPDYHPQYTNYLNFTHYFSTPTTIIVYITIDFESYLSNENGAMDFYFDYFKLESSSAPPTPPPPCSNTTAICHDNNCNIIMCTPSANTLFTAPMQTFALATFGTFTTSLETAENLTSLLLSGIFGFVALLAVAILSKRNVDSKGLGEVFFGVAFLSLTGFSIATDTFTRHTWFPAWILVISVFLIAMILSGALGKIIGGGH